MLNFVTLFDSNYYSRGLAMAESLERVCKEFSLFVVAFDKECARRLNELSKPYLTVITLEEFENDALLAVKSNRTQGEYCWTATPFTVDYCFRHYGLEHCIYIDADLFFYANPVVLWQEMAENDHVLITEHRYTPQYDQTETSGRYCVQFVGFKNSTEGLAVLNDWKVKCLDWCYNIIDRENGRFGDQKYLDKWPDQFAGIHILRHLGGGVAPWNCQQYNLLKRRGSFYISEKTTGNTVPLVFYHFHDTKENQYTGRRYDISRAYRRLLYRPYVRKVFSGLTALRLYGLEKKEEFKKTLAGSLIRRLKAGRVVK
jgi:hypothetical protein